MSSRTPMGGQPRPPQRTLSASSLAIQRPSTQQRAISHQYLPSSPARKDGSSAASSFVDMTDDPASDPAFAGAANTPRRAGSKLRLELAPDANSSTEFKPAAEWSETLSPLNTSTPLRTAALPEVDSAGHQSPALSRSSLPDPDNPPMPMPKRRPRPQDQILPSVRKPPATPAIKKDSRPKPYVVEVPAAAPKCPPSRKQERPPRDPFSKGLYSGFADFHPWTGKHHEDTWNSEGVLKGTWDRSSQNETSSARVAIYTPLRQQKGSLNALSQLFMTVLNQRRTKGQVNAPSTFKPPPRVTLTDTKREIWMKDLANPAMSLRRLSRTIPHGIRGRTLLDQCLNKIVPTERAIWLVKCVGANEIRAFKRKGVNTAMVLGGELKWVRDWTLFVEQFLEAVLFSFGDADWKSNVTYAIRLATNLYSEHLLDQDHYLEWLLASLESSSQAKLPMWMLLTNLYWTQIMRLRRFGRRLVLVLLSHLNTISNDPDGDILSQLSASLVDLILTILRQHPESFVNPRIWFKYRNMLKTFLIRNEDKGLHLIYQQIDMRNSRLSTNTTSSAPAGRQRLITALDRSFSAAIDDDLAARCWAMQDNKDDIIRTTVDWATCIHRSRPAKTFIAARLIRGWGISGHDSTFTILTALDGVADDDKIRKGLFYHLIGELVRNGHFSIPHYLQWLIARGGLHDAKEIDPDDGNPGTRLLIELPTHCMADKWKKERATLLRRAGGYSVLDEEQDIETALKCVAHTLGVAGPPDDPVFQRKPMPVRKLLTRLTGSSRALRTAIGAYIRDLVNSQLNYSKGHILLPDAMFTTLRTILETLQDFTMLSEVLHTCQKMADPDQLAACVDTINCNLEVFLAIGSANQLLDCYIERLKAMSDEHGVLARPLLVALDHLAARVPGRQVLAGQLHLELLQCDRTNPIDACSPVSDNMVNQAHTAESEVAEEIEKLFNSGNIIDQPTMNRLFRMMIPRLEAGWRKLNESRRVFASFLTRLRLYDAKHFDKQIADWISHIRTLQSRPPLAELIPLLVSAGCLSMTTLLSTASSPPTEPVEPVGGNGQSGAHGAASYFQELLFLVITKKADFGILTREERYRFRIHQEAARTSSSKSLLSLIRNAIIERSLSLASADGQRKDSLDDADVQQNLLDTLSSLVVADTNSVSTAMATKGLPVEAVQFVGHLTNRLLVPGDRTGSHTSFDNVLGHANELTMPFCQLKLNLDLSTDPAAAPLDGSEPQPSVFDLFAKAMDRAIEADNISWTRMLPCLSNEITLHLKSQAYERFFSMLPTIKSQTASVEAVANERIRMAENLLGVLEVIIAGQPPPKTAQLTQTMVDKLSDLWTFVTTKDEVSPEAQTAVVGHWLPLLLRFITLHSTSASEAMPAPSTTGAPGKAPLSAGHEARARIILVLCGLFLELETRPAASVHSVAQHVLDTAILLVDVLPEESRVQCARVVILTPGVPSSPHLSSDPRLYYLFSFPLSTAADNLVLGKRREVPTPHSSTARLFGNLYGCGPAMLDRYSPFVLKRWELLSEPTPNVGENDTSLSLGLFEAIKIQ